MPETPIDPPNDSFGDPWDDAEASVVANLPNHLRSRCCHPDEPWVDPTHHDHGHTDCYFMNLAADEIERLRDGQMTIEPPNHSRFIRRARSYIRHPRHLGWSIRNRWHGYKFGPIQRHRCCDHTTPSHYRWCANHE